jgi:hypothetical protein
MGEMFSNSLSDAIRISFEVISELADEMRVQFDNSADWAQQSDSNRSRISAAVALGNVHEPSVPASLRNRRQLIEFWWKAERTRPDRLANAVNCLEVCIFYLSKLPSNDATYLMAELRKAIDAIKDTHFPPMFPGGGRKKRRR